MSNLMFLCVLAVVSLSRLPFADCKKNFTKLLGHIYPSQYRNWTSKFTDRIINGSPVPDGRWPFMVSLQMEGAGHFCGGSILNQDTILTAAHCTKSITESGYKASDLQLVIGVNDWMDSSSHNTYKAKWIYEHESYNGDPSAGKDIALVKLSRKITFGDNQAVGRVCLPQEGTAPNAEKCVVMGWGITEEDTDDASRELLQTDVPMLSQDKCGSSSLYNEEDIFCASGKPNDSCQGDSGGPYMCPLDADETKWAQYGIVSYGHGCGRGVGFYTKSSKFVDWILEHSKHSG